MDPIRKLYAFLGLVVALTILAVVIMTQLAAAESDAPSSILASPSLPILRPMENMAVVYGQHGNTTSIYQQGPGLSWDSQEVHTSPSPAPTL